MHLQLRKPTLKSTPPRVGLCFLPFMGGFSFRIWEDGLIRAKRWVSLFKHSSVDLLWVLSNILLKPCERFDIFRTQDFSEYDFSNPMGTLCTRWDENTLR